MTKIPVGVVIKQIMEEKGLRPKDVAEKLKMSRQNVYLGYSRMEMSTADLRRWAHGLGVTWDEINRRRDVEVPSEANLVQATPGAEYLMEHLTRLEENFKVLADEFKAQIAVKDRQIEKLLDLLGKLDLSEEEPCYSLNSLIKLRA